MTDREKKLAIAVGILGVLGLLYLAWGFVDRQMTTRNNRIFQLEKEINEKELEYEKGRRAVKKIREFERKSLPSDINTARTDYPAWLFQELEEVGIDDAKVTLSPTTTRRGPYQDLRFDIKADANLLQVIEFMNRFYNVDDLHRIYSYRLDPDKDNDKLLQFSATIDAALLKRAEKQKEIGRPVEEPVDVSKYMASIAERNPFAPANRPPKFSRIGTKRVSLEYDEEKKTRKRISFDLKASDADEDKLRYEIIEGPDGARLSDSGGFSYYSEEPEKFIVKARVFDNGIPSKEDIQTFEVITSKAEKKAVTSTNTNNKPKFDHANFTYVVGTLKRGERHEVWFHIRTTGEVLKLGIGDDFKVGTMKGVVEHIEVDTAEIRTEKEILLVELGKTIAQAVPLKSLQDDGI